MAADGGRLYIACFGNPWGFQVADLANPEQPVVLGEITAPTSPLPYKVQARTDLGAAWVVTNAGTLFRRYDVSNPAAPVQVASVACGAQPFGFGINEDASLALVATTNSAVGLRVIDVATTSIIGSLPGAGYADAAVEGDIGYATSFTAGALHIIDLSTPSSPSLLASVPMTPSVRRVVVQNRIAYVKERDVGPQGGQLRVVDCTNPSAPVLTATLNFPNTTDEANIEIQNNILIGGNAGPGAAGRVLRIWSLANPLQPTLLRAVQFPAPDRVFAIAAAGDYAYIGNREFAPNKRVFTLRLR